MVQFEKFTLNNGLTVIVSTNKNSSMVNFNLLYKVGSKHENPNLTGFAHLFEHLMFKGTKKFPDFEGIMDKAGAANNAYTTKDLTTYYCSIPYENIEVVFEVEADRMINLRLDQPTLESEKSVVIEEFKERYLSKPFGDWYLKIFELAYKKHPYQWATIGREISHIEKATLEDVTDFYNKFYAPNNAVLTIVGNVDVEYVKFLAEKYFGKIKKEFDISTVSRIEEEPVQKERRLLDIKANVPNNAIYMAYHMPKMNTDMFYDADLITDILGRGESARLHQRLVKDNQIFSTINCFQSGLIDSGLLMIVGYLKDGISFETAEELINKEINLLKTEEVSIYELEKVKNMILTAYNSELENMGDLADNLAFYENVGDTDLVNTITDKYKNVDSKRIMSAANAILSTQNSSVIYYAANENK